MNGLPSPSLNRQAARVTLLSKALRIPGVVSFVNVISRITT